MPLCPTCKAYVNEEGEWAPAAQLSAVSTERDKAVREAAELRCHVGSLRAEATAARDARKEELNEMLDRVKLLNYRIERATQQLDIGDAAGALKTLKGEIEP